GALAAVNSPPTTVPDTLSLHDALPIYIQSAVTDDSNKPKTAIRESSVCQRPASGPRNRVNHPRHPPVRRATSNTPVNASTSIARALTAAIKRPPSPRKSER